jgi:hypothetical protein
MEHVATANRHSANMFVKEYTKTGLSMPCSYTICQVVKSRRISGIFQVSSTCCRWLPPKHTEKLPKILPKDSRVG